MGRASAAGVAAALRLLAHGTYIVELGWKLPQHQAAEGSLGHCRAVTVLIERFPHCLELLLIKPLHRLHIGKRTRGKVSRDAATTRAGASKPVRRWEEEGVDGGGAAEGRPLTEGRPLRSRPSVTHHSVRDDGAGLIVPHGSLRQASAGCGFLGKGSLLH